MSWYSVLRALSAVLLLVVAFYNGGDSTVVTPRVNPVIDVDSSAAFVLTDTGEGTTVSTPYFFDSRVQEALKDNGYQWKRFDDSVDIESQVFLADHWKSAYKKAIEDSNGKRPWLIIGNPKGGESIPLPEQPEKIVDLINRYGDSE